MQFKSMMICAVAAVCVLIGVDQSAKQWATDHLVVFTDSIDTHVYQGSRRDILQIGGQAETDEAPTFGAIFQWNYVRNHGAAWGFMANMPEGQRQWVFQLGTLALCLLLAGLAFQQKWRMPNKSRAAILFIVGGAVGNLMDRVKYQYVIDVFDFKLEIFGGRYALPPFNIADMMIVCGLCIATLAEFLRRDNS